LNVDCVEKITISKPFTKQCNIIMQVQHSVCLLPHVLGADITSIFPWEISSIRCMGVICNEVYGMCAITGNFPVRKLAFW
jgi:hypothetical protein